MAFSAQAGSNYFAPVMASDASNKRAAKDDAQQHVAPLGRLDAKIRDWARRLRKYLEWARLKRSELFANDKNRKQVTFYDLRATGITGARSAVMGRSRS